MKDFAHYIKVRFGCAPNDPTDSQVERIKAGVLAFVSTNRREPDIEEMRKIVHLHCPSAGTYKYGADVNADLRRQIALLAAEANR